MVLFGRRQRPGAAAQSADASTRRDPCFWRARASGTTWLQAKSSTGRTSSVLRWVADGSLDVKIHGEYVLSDAAQAHTDLEGRATTGKLLLIP